ncbi:hypothetical protein ACRSLK_09760 [Halopseudomonas pachastrellae]|uniref:hypothetical protein n=1 Tax=Halopseudomonas pachastrellae TaxID=254161 RepID=UPI003D7CF15C
MKKAVFVLLLLCINLTGCAFTVHDVSVNYRYNKPVTQNLSEIQRPPVSIGQFTDERAMGNPRMILNMQNLNGQTTTGGWQAEKPVAEIVKDGITQGLEQAKLPISDSGAQLELKGELLEFDYTVIMGAWNGTVQPRLMVKLDLVDTASNEIIWRDTFISKSSLNGNVEIPTLLKSSIDQLVTDLLEDRHFVQKITTGS